MQMAVGTTVLINLLGGVALLLWGLRMVRTGVTRAYGGRLRRQLGRSLSNRYKAFGAGIAITCLLQSSTATSMLASSFAGQGAIAIAPTLALLLGADIGTTLVAQALSFDLSLLKPILLFGGVCLFLNARSEKQKHIGRITLGLGLMLLALQMIVSASTPMRESSTIQFLLSSLAGEPVLALLIGATISLLAHSSLATVLLVISLAASQSLPLNVGFILILGANLGGALPPLIAALGSAAAVRRPPLGNFLFRLAGVILVLPFLNQIIVWLPLLEAEPARQLVNFHLLFNVGVALLFLPLVHYAGQFISTLVPDREEEEISLKPRYLDRSALDTPSIALSNSLREVLRMGDLLESMVDKSFDALNQHNSAPLKKICQTDDLVDEYHEKIKLYLTELSRNSLDENERQRCNQIQTFTTNLEHIGDIVETSLADLIKRTVDNNIQFSRSDLSEINQLHQSTQSNMKLAFSVLMSGDLSDARLLLEQKMSIRENERKAIDSHQLLLQEQPSMSHKDSALFQDILRDLKRINSHLASVAYPLLDQAGELRSSRLRQHPQTQSLSEAG